LVFAGTILRFVMRNGDIVASLYGSDDQNEGHLFEALVKAGALGSLERHEVLRIAHARQRPGLEVLLAMGIVPIQTVEPVLRHLLRETFAEAMRLSTGHFVFRTSRNEEQPPLPTVKRVSDLLLASLA
jgi:hypothetical protein